MAGTFVLLEAPTRFELVIKVLQTSALPLGDGADRRRSGVQIEVPNRPQGVKEKILCLVSRGDAN